MRPEGVDEALADDGLLRGIAWLVRPDGAVPADDHWLAPAELARLAGLVVPVRRQGRRLRRFAAKEALAAVFGAGLGPWSGIEIANLASGAPEARRQGERLAIGLSLTDRAGWAACALAPDGVAVGCDLELVEPRSAAFVADWLTPAEQQLVATAGDAALAANLIWSAKESALKVLGEGLRRPTRSVEVSVEIDGGGEGFSPLIVTLEEGGELTGWWRRLGGFVFTVAAGVPTAPPAVLGGPVPGR